MIFRFLILSDEIEDFKREIQIDPDATFYDFHQAILKSTNYKDGEMTSFFICQDDWSKEQEITLVEMNTDSDVDSFTMQNSVLSDFLEDEHQKLMYVFDYMTERAFFMELCEIITGKEMNGAICIKSEGEPPLQFVTLDAFESNIGSLNVDENFYGDESYDINELDVDGFDGLDDVSQSNQDEY